MNPPIQPASRRGVALVIVLGLLVIILGLTVTFLNRTTIERNAAAGFAAASSSRQLADTAVNLVQGQIRDATTQGANVAWASQPGMIRTFASGNSGSYSASADLLRTYKLYSSDTMIATSANTTADLPPASWETNKAVWTDLNAPVTVNGEQNFPILDPAALGTVEGFTASSTASVGVVTGNGTDRRIPMPVRWLYVTKNGTLVAPTGNGTVAGASATNPITGRIAFWTDDETSKININTASEGTIWDSPRTWNTGDQDLAKKQPARNEFQRYPGHPAMTSLAPVLFATSATSTPRLDPAVTADKAKLDAIYSITPRVIGGGSESGTKMATGTLEPDSDRLYASVDEMIFSASRSSQAIAAGLDKVKLERSRFFLTATSRAPEVTLFNTPRVSMWPLEALGSTAGERTTIDKLFAFVSTINPQGLDGYSPQQYYFQRKNPKSATEDFAGIPRNQTLYKYLQALTGKPFPGFGGKTFATKFGVDRDQILTEMFDYIRITNPDDSLITDKKKRYGYRAQVDPTGANGAAGQFQFTPIRIGNGTSSTQGFGRFPVISELGLIFIATADSGNGSNPTGLEGSNDPARNPSLGGTALAPNQRRIQAMLAFETFVPGQGYPQVMQSFVLNISGLDNFEVNGTNLGFPASGDAMQGFSWVQHARRWGGSNSMTAFLNSCKLPTDTGGQKNYPFIGVPITVSANATLANNTMSLTGGNITVKVYNRTSFTAPGYSSGDAPVSTMTITFPNATIPVPKLVIKSVTANSTAVAPGYTTATPATAFSGTTTTQESWWSFGRNSGNFNGKPGRMSRMGTETTAYYGGNPWTGSPFINNWDVVRSMVPGDSDYRLVMLAGNSTFTNFQPHPLYSSSTTYHAHSLVQGGGAAYMPGVTMATSVPGAGTPANLISGLSYYPAVSPDVPKHNSNSTNYGDFDNGLSTTVDGAYMNLPDVGNTYGATSGGTPYFNLDQYTDTGVGLFSPNRQIPSPGMFGSLPAGAKAGIPWRTLLFRPEPGKPFEPSSSYMPGTRHPGAAAPYDHLWTDLFWMPVVEPYAISEPFSTAGKVNLNFQIAPFNYIRRSTALIGVLRAETLPVIPDTKVQFYKGRYQSDGKLHEVTDNFRLPIDAATTLRQFDHFFTTLGEFFRSPSQIMDFYLVPLEPGVNAATISTYWNTRRITGDNSRERPYANLLGRLTTKSNSYTVHYRVQSLKKAPTGDADVWVEGKDKVTGEYRGSTTIERYINPNDPTIPDYAAILSLDAAATPNDIGQYYKWRTVNTRQFAP